MHPDSSIRLQRGFGLPLAVFIITVLALIGTAMVALTRTGQESVASEIQSIRAFYAAESGAQLALVAVLPLTGGSIGVAGCNALSLNPAFNAAGLEGCTASVSCSGQTVNGQDYYRILSLGECRFGASGNTARRRIEVMAKGP
ncbi:MAG TPA: hypothetical protein ENI93_04795 [Gammaproteobacteria bacterium]|nr:hypothetical protein [Gammaproteobacteria bacterium]